MMTFLLLIIHLTACTATYFYNNSCKYGTGVLKVNDDLNNVVVYNEKPEFGAYLELKFELDEAGKLTFKSKDTDYENSWESAAAVPNYPQQVDQSWPGPLPTIKGSLIVNIKFDRFPDQIDWTFSKRGSTGDYTELTSFDGATEGVSNDMVSTQIPADQLGEGWYKFAIVDGSGDGICCTFRRGWVAITGYILSTRNAGLVWGNNGEFGSGTEIYMLMNSKGYIKRITADASVVA